MCAQSILFGTGAGGCISSEQDARGYLAKASCSCQKDLKMLQLPVVVWASTPPRSCAGLHALQSVPTWTFPLSCSKQPLHVGKEETIFPT